MFHIVRRALAKSPWVCLGLLLIASASLLPLGCQGRTKTTKTNTRVEEDDDHLTIARELLRKNASVDVCKSAVAQLNVALSRPGESKPQPLSVAEHDLLATQLNDDDLAEINRPDFTILDGHYLESCLLFHDAVRALNLDFADKSASALRKRAELAFAWAMREVWLLDGQFRPLPPSMVLRKGFGNVAERAAVALAAFQQAGLDAGLVGQASAGAVRAWAVGVLVDDQVYLFDARTGAAVKSADGKEILTLKQARAEPDRVAALLASTGVTGNPKAAVSASRVWLSPPYSAFAPRMRWLQGALNTTPPTVLGVDPIEQVARFAKAGETVDYWGPVSDATAPLRLLVTFLPVVEGGRDAAKQGERAIDVFARAVIPFDQLPAIARDDKITAEARNQVHSRFGIRFVQLLIEPSQPRDLLLRGQFDEASHELVERLSRIDTIKQRLANEPKLEKDAAAWMKEVTAAEAEYLRIKNGVKDGDLDEAKDRLEYLNKSSEKFQLLIERSAAEPFAAVLSFQIALCKHEQAERQSRDHGSTASHHDAWQDAAGWWSNFLTRFGTASWLPQSEIAQAQEMLAIAQRHSAASEAKSN